MMNYLTHQGVREAGSQSVVESVEWQDPVIFTIVERYEV